MKFLDLQGCLTGFTNNFPKFVAKKKQAKEKQRRCGEDRGDPEEREA